MEIDDVLGWLYESYNTNKKMRIRKAGRRREYNKVKQTEPGHTPGGSVNFWWITAMQSDILK
jgi:hypothetical protein